MNSRNHGSKHGFAWGLGAIALAATLAGCGKNPVAPAPLPPLSAVVITPVSDTLLAGQQKQFTAVAYDTLGSPVAGATFAWKSDDAAVFTVSATGRVRGVSEGHSLLVVSAGGKSDTATVVVYRQTGWYTQTSRTSATLNGLFFLPDGRSGWAVGNAGTIVATTDAGDHWAFQTSRTSFDLNAVWFTGAGEGWAVGDNGAVRHTFDGGANWSIVIAGATENLMDVTFATPDTGWIVGSAGVVLRTFDGGATWQKRYPTGFNLQSVSFSGTLDGWAVGDGGVIIGTHDRGLTWFIVQPAVTGLPLKAVWRRSEAMAWAVGGQGAAPRTFNAPPDTTRWELRNAGVSFQLEGVHFPEDAIGYAVGFNGVGAALRTDDGGMTWQTQTSNSQFRLNDVFFVDAMRGWAVGNTGVIVHTARGGLP